MAFLRRVRRVAAFVLFVVPLAVSAQEQTRKLGGEWAGIELQHVNHVGAPAPDPELLGRLPAELASLLQQVNGFVQFGGGLHVRGAVRDPDWHSLARVWTGPDALSRLYPTIRKTDVPFGADCVGDQFFLRKGTVHRLLAESGDVEDLGVSLKDFLRQAQEAPVATLKLEPLIAFLDDGGRLQLGQVLFAFPPFMTREAANGVSMKAIAADEVLSLHAEIARQIRDLPDGSELEFKVRE